MSNTKINDKNKVQLSTQPAGDPLLHPEIGRLWHPQGKRITHIINQLKALSNASMDRTVIVQLHNLLNELTSEIELIEEQREHEMEESVILHSELSRAINEKESIYDSVPVGIFILSSNGLVEFVNHFGADMLSISKTSHLNLSFCRFISQKFLSKYTKTRRNPEHSPIDIEITNREGSRFPVTLYMKRFHHNDGYNTLMALFDTSKQTHLIRELEKKNRELFQLAHIDSVTAAFNRHYFQKELHRTITRSHKSQTQTSLFYIDLDDFKSINDTYGHEIGDEALAYLVRQLKQSTRETDIIARIGGDEFAIIIDGDTDQLRLETLASQFLKAIEKPVKLNDVRVKLSISIGIAQYPNHASDTKQLIKKADHALRRSKRQGKNQYCLYNADLFNQEKMEKQLAEKFSKYLNSNAFTLYYQPQVDIHQKRLVGFEVLLRLRDEHQQLMLPDQFMPHIVKLDLALEVTAFVFKQLCQQLIRWRKHPELNQLQASINIPAHIFKHRDIEHFFIQLAEEYDIPPQRLDLEITEESLVRTSEKSTIQNLADRGFHISVDDFGKGYSCLAYLKQLPIHRLKIDKSFTHSITDGKAVDREVIKTIINLANVLDLQVLAEGVETASQALFFHQHDCHQIQGYLTGAAMPANQFENLVRERDWLQYIEEQVPELGRATVFH